MSYTNTTKQFESDFGYYWLSKFTQVVLAIIPGLFFGYFYPILFQNPLGFSILAAFCLIISFAIHEFVGKKIYAKDEPHIPRYLAYILGFLAINILNFNNVNALSANLILTTVIVLQSVFIENFIFLTVALVLSYLTHIFYIFLPQSARFSDTVSSSSSVELIFLVVLFTLFNYAFYRLQNIKEMEEAEHKDEIDVIREIAFRKKINNVGAVINTLVFGLLFGYTLAGADTYLWGLVTVLLGLISLVIGWFYYHRFSIKSFSIIWFLLFGFYSGLGIFFITDQWRISLGWEFIALILAIISHLPGLKKVKYASIFIFEAAIISFMITEPFAKFFGITTSMTWFIPILISFLAYIIVSHLRKGKSVFQGDTPWELTLQGILILVVSVPLVISTNYISIAWTVIGFSLILIGFLLTDSSVRTFGISIIFLTIFKILLGDVATSSYANLIFSLFVMAPVLIITSLIYQRLHQRKFRPNIIVERPHSLTVFEAASRLEGLTKALEDKYAGIFTNLEKHWNENRTIIGFSFDAFAMHVEGQIKIEEKKAILEVQLPWIAMVFKEQIVSSVDREVGNLLEC